MQIGEFELTEGTGGIAVRAGQTRLRALARYHGRPIGWVECAVMPGTVVSTDALVQAARSQLAWDIPRAWAAERLDANLPEAPRPSVTVVVCTRNRPASLARCLDALQAQAYPDFEIVVVDNAPRTDETERLAASRPVRYMREDRPGLDWARNRGIAEARHDVIAFTDDDTRPDRGWLAALTRPLADPCVTTVCGLVAPEALDTQAQRQFELDYGGMGHGFRRRTVHGETLSARELLWASAYGVGANMAFRRSVFADVGAFDVALDVGTASGGNGDNEMLHRVLARGHTLVYEPAALVWHSHRGEDAALGQLVFNNGRSTGAFLLTCARNRTVPRREIARFFLGQWLGWWLLRRLVRPHGFPRALVALELWGTLISPFAYALARISARQRAAEVAPLQPTAGKSFT